MVSDYATLSVEEDLSTDERVLQLFRDAEATRQARHLTRFRLVVLGIGVTLLVIKLYRMRRPR